MKRNQFFLLGSVVFIFALSTLISLQHHAQTSRLLAQSLKASAWAVYELEREYVALRHALGLYRIGKQDLAIAQEHFSQLQHRVNVLINEPDYQWLRSQSRGQALLSQFDTLLAAAEADLTNPTDTDLLSADFGGLQALTLEQQLAPLGQPLHTLVMESFAQESKQGSVSQAYQLQRETGLYLLGLLLSGLCLVIMVIRERQRSRHQERLDHLTGLPNRHEFHQQLEQAQSRCQTLGKRLAVLVIDLNHFKEINETQGHAAGDLVLRMTAVRIRECLRPGDRLARLGSDEFGILREGVEDQAACSELAHRINLQVSRCLQLPVGNFYISCCIGISLYPDDASCVRQVMSNAGMAMYHAKQHGGAKGFQYRAFEPAMQERISRRKRLADDLRQALQHDQLYLLYQPIVELASGRIESIEALLRWQHPEHGPINPLEVVAIAEQYGMGLELNGWVLRSACQQQLRWREAGGDTVKVSVNISPSMYLHGHLAESVTQVLEQTGLSAGDLIIEVTEDTTMRDIESTPDLLGELTALGVELALDDFGTGYSSLSHLRQLPIHKLKIDKSFIGDLDHPSREMRFIRTIIRLAHSLGIRVVAEGIETEQHYQQLLRYGCHLGQGYLISRPIAAEAMLAQLQQQALGQPPCDCAKFEPLIVEQGVLDKASHLH